MRPFTFSDHYYEKLDIPEDYEEFIQHVKTRIDIESYNEVISTEKYSNLILNYTNYIQKY